MKRLLFRNFREPGAQCHFATPRMTAAGPLDPHWHDFVELFWVDAGRGTHWINGKTQTIHPGYLAFILEEDCHAFGADPGMSLTLVNIAFAPTTWHSLQSRYGSELPDLFTRAKKAGREHQMTPAQLDQLRAAASELRSGQLGPLSLDRFLLNVAWIVGRRGTIGTGSPGIELPAWLSQARVEIQNLPHFRRGVWGFYDLCNKSPEHVARSCRKLLGKTVADVVNDARLTYVATQLAWTDRRVLDIAMDCGLDLSHLHRLFRQRHGVSPGTYRKRQRQIVVN